jgi:hypothetical protein
MPITTTNANADAARAAYRERGDAAGSVTVA